MSNVPFDPGFLCTSSLSSEHGSQHSLSFLVPWEAYPHGPHSGSFSHWTRGQSIPHTSLSFIPTSAFHLPLLQALLGSRDILCPSPLCLWIAASFPCSSGVSGVLVLTPLRPLWRDFYDAPHSIRAQQAFYCVQGIPADFFFFLGYSNFERWWSHRSVFTVQINRCQINGTWINGHQVIWAVAPLSVTYFDAE